MRAQRKLDLSQKILDPKDRAEQQKDVLVSEFNDSYLLETYGSKKLNDSKEMIDLLSYGLTKLDEDGTPFDFSTLFDTATSPIEQVECAPDQAVVDDIYHYEGHDYKADKAALEKLTTPLESVTDLESLTREERLKRVELNRLKKLEAKRQRWEKLGYVSKSFQELQFDLEQHSVAPQQIQNVIGSLTDPVYSHDEKTLICQYVFAYASGV